MAQSHKVRPRATQPVGAESYYGRPILKEPTWTWEAPLYLFAWSVVGLAFEGLIGFGIYCGFRGLSIARATEQAPALPLAGIVVGFVDVVLWLGLTVNLLGILGVLR